MKYIYNITWLCFFCCTICAQDEIIKPDGSGLGLFDESNIEHIRIISSDSQSLLIEVKSKSDEDKTMVLTGELLDERKKKLSAFTCEPAEMSKGSETADLTFKVSKKNTSTQSNLSSSYVRIKMSEKEEEDSLFGDLEGLLGGSGDDPLGDVFGQKFLFKYKKDWRLKGNKNMIVKVPLTPIGDAKTIK